MKEVLEMKAYLDLFPTEELADKLVTHLVFYHEDMYELLREEDVEILEILLDRIKNV